MRTFYIGCVSSVHITGMADKQDMPLGLNLEVKKGVDWAYQPGLGCVCRARHRCGIGEDAVRVGSGGFTS